MPTIHHKLFLGIDPGASGGLAVVSAIGQDSTAMPATERDAWDWIRSSYASCAAIEKVQGYIGPGTAFPGSAMFRFGQSYGFLRGCLIAAGISFEEVTPQRWQKGLGVAPRGKQESKGAFKNRLKAKAQQLFPNVKVTLATADALLIAEYCRRKHGGAL